MAEVAWVYSRFFSFVEADKNCRKNVRIIKERGGDKSYKGGVFFL